MEMPRSLWMDASVVGEGLPDIQTLVDNLLKYDGEAVFMEGVTSVYVLEYLLKGTEDLWGMIDWEKGTCDLSDDLFARIMEAADRYGDEEYNNKPAISQWLFWSGFKGYIVDAYRMQEAGGIDIGYMFDDGSTGADGQFGASLSGNQTGYNSMKLSKGDMKAMDVSLTPERYGIHIPETQIAQEMDTHMQTLTERLEDARPFPMRTEPIMDIILEEAEAYFSGTKSLEEVTDVMENRIGLYLAETN